MHCSPGSASERSHCCSTLHLSAADSILSRPLRTPCYGIDKCPLPFLESLPWGRFHFSYAQNRTGQTRVPIVSTSKSIVRVSYINEMSNPHPEINSEQKSPSAVRYCLALAIATETTEHWVLGTDVLNMQHERHMKNSILGPLDIVGAVKEQCAEGFA